MSKLLEKKPLSTETRERLREYYREEIERLEAVAGKNLSHWKL